MKKYLILILSAAAITMAILMIRSRINDRLYAEFSETDIGWQSQVQAWIYDGAPACNARIEYSDGRKINVLKPEYLTISSTGTVVEIIETGPERCNGYSEENAQDIIAHSDEQYITVSASRRGLSRLLDDRSLRDDTVYKFVNFIEETGFTGIELDWEEWWRWGRQDYTNYKLFVSELGRTLHDTGHKLIIIGPLIYDDYTQSQVRWRYEDFNSAPIDYIIALAYDYQFDHGAGNQVSPDWMVKKTADWLMSRISDINKIVIGLPSYGYHGELDSFDISLDTKQQSELYPGFKDAHRDSDSMEMTWLNDGISYWYQDTISLDHKRELVESLGIKNISIWHLGGNDWFSSKP